MKINLDSVDATNFLVKTGSFLGYPAVLINPKHIGTKFTQTNKIFRSSIWAAEDGELLSASHFKFPNWGESPENFPLPTSLDGCTIVEKIDGSCAIWDSIAGQLSIRTRGTFSVDSMENVEDFYAMASKYPKLDEFVRNHPEVSVLTEIVTPNLKVVIDYGVEVDIFLIGVVNKHNYSLWTQKELDELAATLGLKRPATYTFTSIEDLLNNVHKWEGKEGVVLYYDNDQQLLKIKSADYILKHRMKSELNNIERVVDLFVSSNRPTYQEFFSKIENTFDHEVAMSCIGFISRICNANKEVNDILTSMKETVELLKNPNSQFKTRKDQAQYITNGWGTTGRSGMLFQLLDGKTLSDDSIKKLIYQCLKN